MGYGDTGALPGQYNISRDALAQPQGSPLSSLQRELAVRYRLLRSRMIPGERMDVGSIRPYLTPPYCLACLNVKGCSPQRSGCEAFLQWSQPMSEPSQIGRSGIRAASGPFRARWPDRHDRNASDAYRSHTLKSYLHKCVHRQGAGVDRHVR